MNDGTLFNTKLTKFECSDNQIFVMIISSLLICVESLLFDTWMPSFYVSLPVLDHEVLIFGWFSLYVLWLCGQGLTLSAIFWMVKGPLKYHGLQAPWNRWERSCLRRCTWGSWPMVAGVTKKKRPGWGDCPKQRSSFFGLMWIRYVFNDQITWNCFYSMKERWKCEFHLLPPFVWSEHRFSGQRVVDFSDVSGEL